MIITHRYSIIIHIQIYGFQLPSAVLTSPHTMCSDEKELSVHHSTIYSYIFLSIERLEWRLGRKESRYSAAPPLTWDVLNFIREVKEGSILSHDIEI